MALTWISLYMLVHIICIYDIACHTHPSIHTYPSVYRTVHDRWTCIHDRTRSWVCEPTSSTFPNVVFSDFDMYTILIKHANIHSGIRETELLCDWQTAREVVSATTKHFSQHIVKILLRITKLTSIFSWNKIAISIYLVNVILGWVIA